jgi:hypothetical protein
MPMRREPLAGKTLKQTPIAVGRMIRRTGEPSCGGKHAMAGVLVGIGLFLLVLGVLGGSNLWLIGLGLAVVMVAGVLQMRSARRTAERA